MGLTLNFSKLALAFCTCSIVCLSFLFYPRWNKAKTEATIGWDVSGYYTYLPAVFIYSDLKKAEFLDSVIAKYNPTPTKMQGFTHESGNFVIKYPLGQALQFLPWFAAGHLFAKLFGFPPDGFSAPYQFAIFIGSMIVAILGLWLSRRILLEYFSDEVVAITLVLITLGTNYLNYASIDGAMTHNWLYTCYALVVYFTISFFKSPSSLLAILIGILCGWAVLTRPSEIVILLIPLMWGISSYSSLNNRIRFLIENWNKYFLSCTSFLFVGSLQLVYWRYVSGDYLVYSYEDQGFSWLHPHLQNVLFSYRAGWLTYSPLLLFSIIGLLPLKRLAPSLFPTIFTYFLINLYIVSSWDIWWYGGSLGMRALVQSYAVLAIPMAAFINWVIKNKFLFSLTSLLSIILIWINVWWTIQAHKEKGAYASEQMTKSYFWRVIGRNTISSEWLKLLDTDEIYSSNRRADVRTIFESGFENDTIFEIDSNAINGIRSMVLSEKIQFSPEIVLSLDGFNNEWVRVSCKIRCEEKEWDFWKMTQLIVRFKNGDSIVKESMMRLQRHIEGSEAKYLFLDCKAPNDETFNSMSVQFWNGDSKKIIRIDDLSIESFNAYSQ